MGLKGYRLWAMGQLNSNVQSPTATPKPALRTLGSASTAPKVGATV
jgi:hypothetical protein